MKCTVCKGPAVIDIRRQNTNYCAEHFLRMCRNQVAKAIDDFAMVAPGERVLVAVSGGKDSLALWDILLDLGYDVDGYYIGLGIDGYSDPSLGFAAAYAESRGLHLRVTDLRRDHGYDIPNGSRAAKRVPCSACGLSKRHLFDDAARTGGYDVLATGHNLDDEAAVLFGNVLRWQTDYLARQLPVLPERDGFPRKVKPLVRLGERETAAYCVLRGIDYIVEECPMAAGNKHLGYKEALDGVEAGSPGSKHDFYFGFLRHARETFAAGLAAAPATDGDQRGTLRPCDRCGAPTSTETCAFCRLVDVATRPQPIHFRSRPATGPGGAAPEQQP